MDRTINTPITSDGIFTSELNVQAYSRVGVSIWLGSLVAYEAVTLSRASCSITLQRQLPGDPDAVWRDVEDWTIVQTGGQSNNEESISDKPEPETCKYRLGTKTGDWENLPVSALVYVRLQTM